MRRTSKILLIVAAFLVAAVVALVVAGGLWLNAGRAQRDGEAAVAGLAAPATVRWDRWGVPYVEAASGRDLATVLGWLHANDRFTQMELGRRAAAGRLAELAGPRALPLDRESRTLRLGETAQRLWASAGPETRGWLTAYAAGVNAWLEQRSDDLPPDLRLLAGGDFRPEPWRPGDSLGFVLLMAKDLSFWAGRPEEAHLQWLDALGVEPTVDLAAGRPYLPPALVALARAAEGSAPEEAVPGDDLADPDADVDGGLGAEPDHGSGSPGSNNWAAGTSRTAGPAPALASDPHLPFRLPGTWYQVRLRAPDYDVAGMTLPGIPGVVIGRNRDLAWALTNVMLDDHDLYLEDLRETPEGPRVRRGDGWRPVSVERQEIAVRDGEPEALELRRTDRGPLLPAEPERGLVARSLDWTLYEAGDPLSAFLALGRATTLESVPAAVAGYVGPAQNLVVAHRDGGLLWTVLGRIPRRRQGDGWLPAPGWQERYGWDGLLPRDAMPVVLRPASDLLVTANNDLLAGDAPVAEGLAAFAPSMPADYDSSHRARRIRQLLGDGTDWTAEAFAQLQTDVVDLYALEVRDAALAGFHPGDAALAAAADRLAAWDGRMTVEPGPSSSAAALFALFERELRRRTFGDEAAAHGLERFDSRDRLLRVLTGAMSPAWFDDVATPAVEGRREVVGAALAAAVAAAAERWGDDPGQWSYGDLHTLTQPHPLGGVPVLGGLFQGEARPAPGSATTVAAFGARWTPDGDLRVTYGPSMRWTTDLDDPDRSWSVLPSGQAGHPSDPHYDDQVEAFLAGEVHPFPWSDGAVEAAAVSRLRLLPTGAAPDTALPAVPSEEP